MSKKTKTLAFGGLFTALVAIGAFIQIPVPHMDYFTLQFFFVLLAGMLLGPKVGAASVGCYVLLGLAGVPIFAAGGGIGYILRPSFGFLAAFIVTAYVVGLLADRKPYNFKSMLTSAFVGLLITYVIGLIYKYLMLNLYVGESTPFSVVLLSCFPLDLPGDIVLCILAALVAPRLKKALISMQ